MTEVLEEVELAEGYVKEAEKCKLLLSSLHETTAQREEPTPMNRYLQYSKQGQSELFPKGVPVLHFVFYDLSFNIPTCLQLPGHPVREFAGVPNPAPRHQRQQHARNCSGSWSSLVIWQIT